MRYLGLAFLLISTALSAVADERALIDEHFAVDTNEIPWIRVPIPELDHQLPLKPLFEDLRSGASASKLKYEAVFTNTWHSHSTGHGMYVLDGILRTNKGEYGPGEFVWFPEGERMFHGATEDNDVIFIFIINKHFDIHYE